MERGYVKLWRKTLDSAVMDDPHLLQLWCHLLMSANWKESQLIDGTFVGPGVLIVSQLKLAARWKCSQSSVSRRLKKLEKLGQIVVKADKRWTRVTICNWATYQQDEETPCITSGEPADNLRITRGEPADTSKKGRREEGKKGRKVGSATFSPPSIDEVAAYCQERGNGVDPQRWHDHYTARGWMVGKNKMRDWRAAVRTWERNEYARPSGDSPKREYDISDFVE